MRIRWERIVGLALLVGLGIFFFNGGANLFSPVRLSHDPVLAVCQCVILAVGLAGVVRLLTARPERT